MSTCLARITADAPGLLQEFYLIGSIALDAFQDGHSDVDFVALLGRQQPSTYRSRLARARDTVEIIKYVIHECSSI